MFPPGGRPCCSEPLAVWCWTKSALREPASTRDCAPTVGKAGWRTAHTDTDLRRSTERTGWSKPTLFGTQSLAHTGRPDCPPTRGQGLPPQQAPLAATQRPDSRTGANPAALRLHTLTSCSRWLGLGFVTWTNLHTMPQATSLLLRHTFCHEFCEIHLSEETGSERPKMSKAEHGVGWRAGRAPCAQGERAFQGRGARKVQGFCRHQGPQARREGDRKRKWRTPREEGGSRKSGECSTYFLFPQELCPWS